ncbi:rhomboid family intramembrane serine protease [Pseudomonas aeruginosa]|uniref:rhomboid family intramembrane serine protease n=1 Tax=Pseudomonas aeruginosa TaxID=287 RepID=UPI002B26AB6C|nr:rhomboid family intramembrane serine protease [Pseudomonas aeruginosa]MEA8593014.1 rhomboid family intramembrane serine protease [Pseudomonas aeruginosa]
MSNNSVEQIWKQRWAPACLSVPLVVVAVIVMFFYGGLVFGLLPRTAISFEYHVFGALCGVLFAAMSRPEVDARQGARRNLWN